MSNKKDAPVKPLSDKSSVYFSGENIKLHNKFYIEFSKLLYDKAGKLCSDKQLESREVGYLAAASLLRVAADIFLNLGLDFNTFAGLSDNMFAYEQTSTITLPDPNCTCASCQAAREALAELKNKTTADGNISNLTQEDVNKIIKNIQEKAKEIENQKKLSKEELPINSKIPKNTLN